VAPRLGGVFHVAHAAVEARGVALEATLGVRAVPLRGPLTVHHPAHRASRREPPLADRGPPLTFRVWLGVPCAQFAVGYPTRPSPIRPGGPVDHPPPHAADPAPPRVLRGGRRRPAGSRGGGGPGVAVVRRLEPALVRRGRGPAAAVPLV